MKPRFYHYHFEDNSHITCCNLEEEKFNVVATGYAICSPKDNFCRKRGRDIAEGRALKAYNNVKTTNPILRGSTKAAQALYIDSIHYKSINKKAI